MIIKLNESNLANRCVPTTAERTYYWDSELSGFGVAVGRAGAKTFIVRGREKGKPMKRTIGQAGQPNADGLPWSVQLARLDARAKLGQFAAGKAPASRAERRRASLGPTLQEALDFHIGKMERGENRRGKVCSDRSIETIRGGIELHLAEHLDRALVDLTADALDDVRKRIEREAERVAGSNPVNPPGRALTNRLLANVSVIWRSWHKRYGIVVDGIAIACPVDRLTLGALKPRDNRIANDELGEWYRTVQSIENGVRRDLQMVALFTGVRTEGVSSLMRDDVDFDDELIHIERTKGDRPYTIPMVTTVRDILKRRLRDNVELMKPHGGDGGFVFPALSRAATKREREQFARKTVQAVAETKELRIVRGQDGQAEQDADGNAIRENILPGVQACRKTFNSVALEIGIPKEARESLMNHEGRGVNWKVYSWPQNWDYLRECADKIEASLWQRIRGEVKRAGRGRKLRSVP